MKTNRIVTENDWEEITNNGNCSDTIFMQHSHKLIVTYHDGNAHCNLCKECGEAILNPEKLEYLPNTE